MRNPRSRQSTQSVCPWNGDELVRLTRERDYLPRPGTGTGTGTGAGTGTGPGAEALIPGTAGPAPLDPIPMDEAAWDEVSRGSAIRRAHRAGFLRNVAVAPGNWGAPEAVPALVRALSDPEPLVRGHAAWALGRIGTADARAALLAALPQESDSFVLEELEGALA